MSYYTRVELSFADDRPDIDGATAAARSWLEAQNCYAVDDVLEVLQLAWSGGVADFKGLVSQDLGEMMAAVSSAFPDARIGLRGMGEEFGDIWLREYRGGEAILSIGPFTEESAADGLTLKQARFGTRAA